MTLGGHSDVALLEAAAEVADGWIGNVYPWDECARLIGRLQQFRREAGREEEPFEIICGIYVLPSICTAGRRRSSGSSRDDSNN